MSNPYSPIEVPDVWGHVIRRWPTSTPFKQCAKVAEEAGEVVGAAIKLDEGRRTEQDLLDELADTMALRCPRLTGSGGTARHEQASCRRTDSPPACSMVWYPKGSIWQCGECGQYWVMATRWQQVKWWHLRRLRRIRQVVRNA